MRLIVIQCLALSVAATAAAQFLPPLQAESPEEYDSYLDVLDAATPDQTLQQASRFQERWPKSSLLAHVLQMQFEALTKRGKAPEAIAAANRALALAPDNLAVRADLAVILANEARTAEQLEGAEKEARLTLAKLDAFRPPKSLPFPRWQQVERRVRGQAHTALGLVAFKRDRVDVALKELETAVALSPEPATQYRLGKLYRHVARLADAKRLLRAASAGDDPEIRALAELELRDLER
jgi:tetratricopeptide (TPR) repeat protein